VSDTARQDIASVSHLCAKTNLRSQQKLLLREPATALLSTRTQIKNFVNQNKCYEISGFHGGEDGDEVLLGFSAV
jgi:hypothetical protein